MVFKVKTGLNETRETLDVFRVRREDECASWSDSVAAAVQKKEKKKPTCSSFVGFIHPGKLVFRCRGDMASGPNVHCNLMLQSSSFLPTEALLVFLLGASGSYLPPTPHGFIRPATGGSERLL